MKWFQLTAIFIISSLLMISCTEEFDLNAPYKDITVITGLLDQSQDTTFIRINKAFLGEGDVFQMVKVEDSSIYRTDLTAVIEEYSSDQLKNSFILKSITIDNKEDGLFYNPYQLVYYATIDLQEDRDYKLVVDVKGKQVTGMTKLVNDFSLEKPSAGSAFIAFPPGGDYTITWRSAENGRRYEVIVRFKYKELGFDSPDTISKHLDWFLGTVKSVNTSGGDKMFMSYQNDAFYAYLQNQIPYDDPAEEEDVQERFTNDIDYIIQVAEEHLNTYMEVNEPSNSIVQDKPDYTNITNGLGIFSSRYRKVRTKKIHPETIEEIQHLPVDLKFTY